MKTFYVIKILVTCLCMDCIKRVAKSRETNCKILNLMQSAACQILIGIHLQL